MLQARCLLLGAAFATCACSVAAHSTITNSDYFVGSWEISPDKKCGAENAEYMRIKKNGTFEYGRRGVAEGVGFWELRDDSIAFEMLAAPASFQDIIDDLKHFTRREIWSMQLLPTETNDNEFTGVFGFGEQMKSLTWQRCK